VGLPALNGFVGEFLTLAGTFASDFMDLRWAAVIATSGVVLAAVYLLKMLYLTLWGPITRPENENLPDLSLREVLALAPLCVFMLWIGVAPAGFLKPSAAHLEGLLAGVRARQQESPVAVATLRARPAAPREELAARRPAAAVEPAETVTAAESRR
jgi:NADH-quinone oxidoreductase subunit M